MISTLNAAGLLCSRPNKPHYGYCPSVRPSVCPVQALLKNKKPEVTGVPIFHLKCGKLGLELCCTR